jgi:long-chain acyl-CoA synthetase
MGGTAPSKQKFVYSVPVTEPKEGETAIYRHQDAVDGLITETSTGCKTAQDLFTYNFQNCPNDQFLGRRLMQADGTLANTYTWETYGEVETIAQQIGSGIAKLGLTEVKAQYEDHKIKFVSVYAKNSREWILVDVANTLYGYTTMPIYDTLGAEACVHMFNQTELSTVFLTCNHVEGIAKGIKDGSYTHLKNVVIMDEENFTDEIKALADGATVYTLSQVIEAGKEEILPYPEVKPEDIAFFSYTSGTTGLPKGAMVSHRNVAAAVGGAEKVLPFHKGFTHISYLPLAHVFERIILLMFVQTQGRYGIFGGDVRKIKEDLAILKPDIFVSVPRLFNKFYDAI